MAGDKSRNRDRDRKGGKEKIVNKAKQRQQGQAASAKRRQEERDKMQKLQLEIAKKQQLKVMIPDEINVGELAARMKKSAGEVIKRLIKLGVLHPFPTLSITTLRHWLQWNSAARSKRKSL